MENKDFILKVSAFSLVGFALIFRLVSEAMGGAVEKEKMHEFSWILHLSELKIQLQSNVIPIGFIKKGIYYHRALLFKVQILYPHGSMSMSGYVHHLS